MESTQFQFKNQNQMLVCSYINQQLSLLLINFANSQTYFLKTINQDNYQEQSNQLFMLFENPQQLFHELHRAYKNNIMQIKNNAVFIQIKINHKASWKELTLYKKKSSILQSRLLKRQYQKRPLKQIYKQKASLNVLKQANNIDVLNQSLQNLNKQLKQSRQKLNSSNEDKANLQEQNTNLRNQLTLLKQNQIKFEQKNTNIISTLKQFCFKEQERQSYLKQLKKKLDCHVQNKDFKQLLCQVSKKQQKAIMNQSNNQRQIYRKLDRIETNILDIKEQQEYFVSKLQQFHQLISATRLNDGYFIQIQQIREFDQKINLYAQIVNVTHIEKKNKTMAQCLIGDQTGCIKAFLHDQQQELQQGETYCFLNVDIIRCRSGRLLVKNGIFQLAKIPLPYYVNLQNNISYNE